VDYLVGLSYFKLLLIDLFHRNMKKKMRRRDLKRSGGSVRNGQCTYYAIFLKGLLALPV
jgi:hypothetical protein